MTSHYEFRVDGRLTDQAREAFCDMRIEESPAERSCPARSSTSRTCSASWPSAGRWA